MEDEEFYNLVSAHTGGFRAVLAFALGSDAVRNMVEDTVFSQMNFGRLLRESTTKEKASTIKVGIDGRHLNGDCSLVSYEVLLAIAEKPRIIASPLADECEGFVLDAFVDPSSGTIAKEFIQADISAFQEHMSSLENHGCLIPIAEYPLNEVVAAYHRATTTEDSMEVFNLVSNNEGVFLRSFATELGYHVDKSFTMLVSACLIVAEPALSEDLRHDKDVSDRCKTEATDMELMEWLVEKQTSQLYSNTSDTVAPLDCDTTTSA
jgi:hypothetical protein